MEIPIFKLSKIFSLNFIRRVRSSTVATFRVPLSLQPPHYASHTFRSVVVAASRTTHRYPNQLHFFILLQPFERQKCFFCFKTVTSLYNCKYSDFCQSFMTIRYVPFEFCSRNCTGDNPPKDCFGLSLL